MADPRIHQAGPGDWQRVRRVRLAALADAPDAFWTTLEEARDRPADEWRNRLGAEDAATFLATLEGRDVGMAVGAPWRPHDEDMGLYAMWVAPTSRGTGVADALVGAVVAWAQRRGARRLLLDVADDNVSAIALYARHGFEPTGNRTTLPPPRTHITEHERARDLT